MAYVGREATILARNNTIKRSRYYCRVVDDDLYVEYGFRELAACLDRRLRFMAGRTKATIWDAMDYCPGSDWSDGRDDGAVYGLAGCTTLRVCVDSMDYLFFCRTSFFYGLRGKICAIVCNILGLFCGSSDVGFGALVNILWRSRAADAALDGTWYQYRQHLLPRPNRPTYGASKTKLHLYYGCGCCGGVGVFGLGGYGPLVRRGL